MLEVCQLCTGRLRDVSFSIRPGEYKCFCGPSGSGKTELLEALCGIVRIRSGSATWRNKELRRLPIHRRGLAYVPTDLALFEHLSVEENVRFALRRESESSDTRVAEIGYALEVEGLFSKAPGRLSQAEKVRAAVARAMVADPYVILLDDVLRELDPMDAAETGRLIKQAQHRCGVTILHMTRDFTEAFRLGGCVAILIDGRIAQEGSPGELHAHPANQQVEQIVAGWGAVVASEPLNMSL